MADELVDGRHRTLVFPVNPDGLRWTQAPPTPRGGKGGALYLWHTRCQGAVVALHPPLDATPEAVAEALAPLRNDFSVAMWTPGNPFAVGAVIRVAHNFLAREVFLVGKAPFYAKASMGMHRFEKIIEVEDGAALQSAVAGRPVWAVEKDHARRSIHTVTEFPPGVVFLFGSERSGLPPAMLHGASEIIGIPVYGVNQSLPLAVAAGIVMSEWARRRYVPGKVV